MIDRPCCAWCKKPLRYQTTTLAFEAEGANSAPPVNETWWKTIRLPAAQIPRSREAAQKHTNQKIVSVKRGWRYVDVWDGENYMGYPRNGKPDEGAIFCGLNCAAHFGTSAHYGGYRRKKGQ